MPQVSNKRGQRRKYGSKEEKARQDIIARRARRRLQSTAARDNIRFKKPFHTFTLPYNHSPELCLVLSSIETVLYISTTL
jgi:hypothetical protein